MTGQQRKIQPTHPWKKFVEHPPVKGKGEQIPNSKLPNWQFRVIPR